MGRARKKLSKKQLCRTITCVLGMLIWVMASVIVAQLIVGYLMLWILGSETFLQPVPTAIYSALTYTLALALTVCIPPLVYKKWQKSRHDKNPAAKTTSPTITREEMGLRDWPTWTDIGLAPVGYIVSLLLAAGLVGIFSMFPWFDAKQAQEVGFSYYLTGADRVIAFAVLVVIAPVIEELIFRGWLYGKVRGKLSEIASNATSMVISALLVSLAFGIVHLQWNVGVDVFALSLVLCALREITGTIYAGILVHMLKNGVAFYLLYVLGVG